MGLITQSKLRSNPESNVGLLTLGGLEVLTTLTTDSGKILAKLTGVQPKGDLNLIPGIKIAHLALKHRLGKNHKMRIVAFVGSPVGADEKDLVKLAKKLKKEKVENCGLLCPVVFSLPVCHPLDWQYRSRQILKLVVFLDAVVDTKHVISF